MLLCLLKVLQGSWTEVKQKCSISCCILLSPKYSRGMTVGTKTSAGTGCLKHFTPSFHWKTNTLQILHSGLLSESSRRAAGDPTHGKVKELMVFLDALVLGASTMSTLHEPKSWITASTALLQPTGLYYDWHFLRYSRQWTVKNAAQKSLPSFSLELFLLFPHYCHLHFAQLAWHKPSKSSEAHLGRRQYIT